MPVFSDYSPAAFGEKPHGEEPVEETVGPEFWPSEAQFRFLKSLVTERELGEFETQAVEDARRRWYAHTLSKSQVSKLISDLKRLPYAKKEEERLVPGIYVSQGTYYKVVPNQEGTGLYAKQWVGVDAGGWQYIGRVPSWLRAEHKATAEQAAAFGKVTGQCVFCSRLLTDERSLAVGYGPVCADKAGLPWGEQ